MRDPFLEPPGFIIKAVRPVADWLSLTTLPLHAHEILLAWASYHFIQVFVSPIISPLLFPKIYPGLPARTKINWDVRVVSFIQAIFISSATLYVILNDAELGGTDWRGRIWGYSGAGGMVQAFAAGYFLWDVIISAIHLKLLGPGSLAHAVSALLITSLGFRPFANYYGLNFVLYALSTPFLNLHWMFDKVNMTGTYIQLYNGITLLIVFFCCRVIWGNYQSICIYIDVWKALQSPVVKLPLTRNATVFDYRTRLDLLSSSAKDASTAELPIWLVFLYLGGNTVLNFLNIFWFWKMIETVRSRFRPASKNIEKAATNGEKAFGPSSSDQKSSAIDKEASTTRKRLVLPEEIYSS